jgi:predicted metal-dependent phosphoesterase TrpH
VARYRRWWPSWKDTCSNKRVLGAASDKSFRRRELNFVIRELKADLHIHSAEDPFDVVLISARALIDRAAQLGYEALAITNHLTNIHTPELADYAAQRGMALVPGAEVEVGKRHFLVLNPTEEALAARNFEELRLAKKNSGQPMAYIAPHPFFPGPSSLGKWIFDNADLFDALEYCAYYFRGLNYNRLAQLAAKRLRLPLIGNSDAHYSWQFGRTYSMIRAEKSVTGIIEAIIQKRVRVVSRPLPLNRITLRLGLRAMGIPEYVLWNEWREGDPYWDSEKQKTGDRGQETAPDIHETV